MLGFAGRTGDAQGLLGLLQFRPQCQNFCLAGQTLREPGFSPRGRRFHEGTLSKMILDMK